MVEVESGIMEDGVVSIKLLGFIAGILRGPFPSVLIVMDGILLLRAVAVASEFGALSFLVFETLFF